MFVEWPGLSTAVVVIFVVTFDVGYVGVAAVLLKFAGIAIVTLVVGAFVGFVAFTLDEPKMGSNSFMINMT